MVSAIIVECKTPRSPSRVFEARAMAESIGYDIKSCIVQKRKSVHHTYFIGPGKLEEIKKIIDDEHIDTLIFTGTVPGSQIFKIRREIGDIKVIDRNLLILEVFDNRAMTKEAKLQIELARLRYTFSWGREFIRLKGITREQVGWSGPGDYPFAEYERAARKKISKIRQNLRKLRFKKRLQRIRRHELGYPIVALAGYTQSGKTTFFNRLVSESKKVGLGPFTTLSPCSRLVSRGFNGIKIGFILIDSIGFIENMHPMVIDAFEVTLDEICNSDLLLLFIDVSENLNRALNKIYSINKILRRMETDSDMIICANKIDIANEITAEDLEKSIRKIFINVPVHKISSKTGENLEELLDKISLLLLDKTKKKISITAS